MEYHFGRLIDHVHLFASDIGSARRFYEAVLAALGRMVTYSAERYFASDELFVSDRESFAHEPGNDSTSIHLAFQAKDHEQVQAFHAAGLAAGGRDNGAPGPRKYHPGYYSAFLLDPDGNNIEAVYHGPSTRSVESIVMKPSHGS